MNIQAQKLELVEMILGINNAKVLKKLKATLKEVVAAPECTASDDSDETTYLLSSEANRKELSESIAQLNRGEGAAIKIKDLWK